VYTCNNLKLIVTTKPGKENVVELQVGDAIYFHDNDVRIVHTGYRGVLLVYTSLDPWQAFWKVMSNPIHGASRIVPVEICVQANTSLIVNSLLKLVENKKVREVSLEVTVRGKHVDEDELKNMLRGSLLQKKILIKHKAKHSAKVEVIDNIAIIAIIPKDIDKISKRISLILKSIGLNNMKQERYRID